MRTVLIAFIIILLFSNPVVCAEKVIIFTSEWFPYVSEELEGKGVSTEIVTAAFSAVGIETEFQFTTWKKCERLVRTGKAFASFPYFRTDERAKFSIFSDPIGNSDDVFFYLKKNLDGLDYDNLAELEKYKIAGAKGYWYKPLFSKNNLNVDYNLMKETSFKKLYWGMTDLVPESSIVGWSLLSKMFPGEKYLFASSKAFRKSPLYLMVSKKYPDSKTLLEKFNNGMKIIHRSGMYQSLSEKFKEQIKLSRKNQIRFNMRNQWNYR
jgi:polar amino acid transport system substrate-binding protein